MRSTTAHREMEDQNWKVAFGRTISEFNEDKLSPNLKEEVQCMVKDAASEVIRNTN